MFIFLAITSIKDKGNAYIPAKYENGEIELQYRNKRG